MLAGIHVGSFALTVGSIWLWSIPGGAESGEKEKAECKRDNPFGPGCLDWESIPPIPPIGMWHQHPED